MKNTFQILVLLLCSIAFQSKCQPRYLQLTELTPDQGLSSSTVISTIQDNNGFMWIATADGLNRFDGTRFKVYKHSFTDSTSIPDNLIHNIYIDKENNMFVGTNAGLSRYNKYYDNFESYIPDSTSGLFNLSFRVVDIDSYAPGKLLLASDAGLVLFDWKNNVFDQYGKIFNQSGNANVRHVFKDSKGNIWLATQTGLGKFDIEDKTFRKIDKGINGNRFLNLNCREIVEDHNGIIWISSNSQGLFRIDDNREGKERLQQFKNDPNDHETISKNRLLTLLVDKQNNLWVGAENDGLFLYDSIHQKFSHFLCKDHDPYSFKTLSVENIYQDNCENLWIGTYSNGVQIVKNNGESIVSYERFKGGDLSISNNVVNSFLQDKDGDIWIATDGGGINKFDTQSKLFKNHSSTNSKMPSNYNLAMVQDDSGLIWISTWGEGLVCHNPKSESFKSFNTRNSEIDSDDLFHIVKGQNNDLWLASYNEGLIHYNYSTLKFETFNKNIEKGTNYINVIRLNSAGNLYLGTNHGFLSFNTQTKQFNKYNYQGESNRNLSHLHIYDILLESDSSIWIGTLSGLNHLNPLTGNNKWYTIDDGLPSMVIRGILKDDEGQLWLSTTGGICRFDYLNNQSVVYTKDDGLQSNEFRPRSSFKSKDGALYFGGFNGFDVIYPAKISKNNRVPDIRITGFDIFNKPAEPGIPNSPLKKIISETKEIKLKYSQSVVTFHFSAMDFTEQKKNQHAYMLENFDKDWTYCGNRKSATYTNLDPGTYVFRVKGSNNDGVWNEEGISLKIVITPPWWLTWWFKTAVFFIIAFTVVGVFYFRISVLNKQKHILESTVKARTKELANINATKDKLFTIIAHDLRNPFNAILGYSDLLINQIDKMDKKTIRKILLALNVSGKNAFSLLDNLLNWSKSQRALIDFVPEKVNVYELIDNAIEEARSVAKGKGVEVVTTFKNTQLSVQADVNMLSLILRNIISNAIKFSVPNGQIWINIGEEENEFVLFSIVDEGKGIESSRVDSLFSINENKSTIGTNGEKGSGLGLVLVKEFVEKHQGKVWIKSALNKGTTFNFTIPKVQPI